LAGRYAVERELGRGGMAVVYLARDLRHERRVALKVLRPELLPSLGAERFLREIRLAAALQHPHILPLFDSGEAAGLLYYVMPYVEGESLRGRLAREVQLPLDQALRIAREVADALQYAHDCDVVHRDVKPENILLSGGHALVADFGIARAIRAAGGLKLTDAGLALGTPAYMSPEQATGQDAVDERADIYALGCVVYEMLAGAPPFVGRSAQAVMARHSVDPVPQLTALRKVPAALEQVVLKALAKSPDDRWPTAAAFGEALTTPDLAGPGFGARRARYRAAALALAAGVAIILAGVAGWATWPRQRAPDLAVADSLGSVAVLPFELLGDTTQAHIASGLTEAVITGLVKLEGVRVPASSNLPATRRGQDPLEIGRALQVDMVLSSTLQMARGRLRLTSRLIDVEDRMTVWSEHFDGEMVDVFAMQDSITAKVVLALKPRLAPSTRAALVGRSGTRDPEVYNLYLLGRHFFSQATPAALRQAMHYYRQAIARDSAYVDPLVGLVEAHLLLHNVEPGSDVALEPAPERILARALAADSTHGGAHNLLARYRRLACDFPSAEREFRTSIRFAPGSAENRRNFALFLLDRGRAPEAVTTMREAAALEPTSPWTLAVLAMAYLAMDRLDSAYAVAARGFALDTTNWVANAVHGWMRFHAGELEDGIRFMEAAIRLGGHRHSLTLGNMGSMYARAGRRAEAEGMAAHVTELVRRGEASRLDLARIYDALGDSANAAHWRAQPPRVIKEPDAEPEHCPAA
jgi:serine/threonine-protein kinase